MPYESDIGGTPIIDQTPSLLEPPAGQARGFIRRDWERYPLGSFAAPFPLTLIPRSEWRDRIQACDRIKAWPKDHAALSGVKVKDQNGTSYCWVFATTSAVEYSRAIHGMPHVSLSPASVGAPIKKYRNVGGWGSEALEYIIEHGLVPTSDWPDTAIKRSYDTAATQAARAKYRVTEWWELPDRSFDAMATCLMLGYPVSVGYNFWSHQVLACRLVIKGSDYFVEIQNSWSTDWSDNGFGLLTENKGTPDDACTPRVATAIG